MSSPVNDVPDRPTGAAVFLSYASQDAAAARRMCETLREAGVEVWFDADGGLEHGDEWDAKIRNQIKECVLFIPILSASTQARLEGYFRIEWELAAQRAMGIASGVPFILPVVIDDTREPAALVPDRFRAVQWTRLPGGVVTPDVKARFLKIWSHRTGVLKHEAGRSGREPGRSRPGERVEVAASPVPTRKDRRVAAWSAALLALVVVLAAAGGWRFRKAASAKPAEKTLAVLPFVTASGDKEEESLSDGIADELLTQLGRAPGLRVSGRMSSFSFKGQKLTESEIARKLEVEYLVTGTFQKNGSQVRIRASLVNAADGFSLWGETFTKELTSVFALQDEIAGLIAQKLQLKFGGAARAQRTVDPAAYGLAQKGRYLWLKRSDEALAEAQAAYEEAITLDPGFAEAHAGLADVCLVRGWYHGLEGVNQGGRLFARARQAAQQAVRLDPTLAEPHAALAALDLNEGRFEESEREFQAALRLNPNYSYAHHWRAHLLAIQGRIDEAVASMARAAQIDPFSLSTLVIRAVFLAHAGQHHEAVAVSDRAIAARQGVFLPADGVRALSLLMIGRQDEALAAARVVTNNLTAKPRWWIDTNAIFVLRRTGHEAEAKTHAERLLADAPADSYYRVYMAAAMGQMDEALNALKRTPVPATARAMVYFSDTWEEIRRSPRFPVVMKELGWLEHYQVARTTLDRMPKEAAAKK